MKKRTIEEYKLYGVRTPFYNYHLPEDIFLIYFKKFSPKLKKVAKLIYYEGYTINEAVDKINNGDIRTYQYEIKKKTQGDISLLDLKIAYNIRNPQEILHKIYMKRNKYKSRKNIPLNLRWKIFNRDGFKCNICGLTKDETILHVDHIIPVSKGGKTVVNNLQTLCFKCNLGKSDNLINENQVNTDKKQ